MIYKPFTLLTKRNRRKPGLILLIMLLLCSFFSGVAVANDDMTGNGWAQQAMRNQYGLYQSGIPVDSQWGNLGAYDAYILTLNGVNPEVWMMNGQSLKQSVLDLMDKSLAHGQEKVTGWSGTEVYACSAQKMAQEYLTAQSWGEVERANGLLEILQERQQISGDGWFDGNEFSDLPALEALGQAGSIGDIMVDKAVYAVVKAQDLNSGAWSVTWNDFMATAQAVRVLHYLNPLAGEQQEEVQVAINRGLNWLKDRQQEDGSFRDEGGFDDPLLDTGEVVQTLTLLGIDPNTWCRSGNSPLDYIKYGAMEPDGTFGSGGNVQDNTCMLNISRWLGISLPEDLVLKLSLQPAELQLTKGQNGQIKVQAFQLDGVSEDVTGQVQWEVEDSSVAEVDNQGMVNTIASGRTNIGARYAGLTASVPVLVNQSSGGATTSYSLYLSVTGDSGTILGKQAWSWMGKSPTVLEVLEAVLRDNGIDYQIDGGYVKSIGGLSHQKPGYPMSGWKYRVNGEDAAKGASLYQVQDGDRIEWYYTLDYTRDADHSGNQAVKKEADKKLDTDKVTHKLQQYQVELKNTKDLMTFVNNPPLSLEQRSKLQQDFSAHQVQINKQIKPEVETVLTDELEEVMLLIPAGATGETWQASIKELDKNQEPGKFAVITRSPVYRFEPSGQQFKQPVTISLPLDVAAYNYLDKLTVARFDNTERKWKTIPGIIDLQAGRAFFHTDYFSDFALVQRPDRMEFPDLSEDFDWARDAVEILAGQGIIQGTGSGFEPGRLVNRGEFIQIVTKSRGIECSTSEQVFSDVPDGHWVAPTATAAYGHGLIAGYPDGSFKPDQPVSTAEVAAILFRAAGREDLANGETGVPLDWAKKALKWAYEQEIIASSSGTDVNRAQAATAVYNWLNLLPQNSWEE